MVRWGVAGAVLVTCGAMASPAVAIDHEHVIFGMAGEDVAAVGTFAFREAGDVVRVEHRARRGQLRARLRLLDERGQRLGTTVCADRSSPGSSTCALRLGAAVARVAYTLERRDGKGRRAGCVERGWIDVVPG